MFLIDGEFHNGVSETTGLDSVAFAGPLTGVPEPSVYGLAGVAVLAGGAGPAHATTAVGAADLARTGGVVGAP